MRLWHDPDVVVFQGRSAGFGAFFQQRLEHGRAYGRQRGARFGTGRNVAGVAARASSCRSCSWRGRRARCSRAAASADASLAALPALFAFDVAWAAGEAMGHLDTLR